MSTVYFCVKKEISMKCLTINDVDSFNQNVRCVGSSEAVLRQVWQWAARAAVGGARLHTALLARLASLPWYHHWLAADCVPIALQVTLTSTTRE